MEFMIKRSLLLALSMAIAVPAFSQDREGGQAHPQHGSLGSGLDRDLRRP